MNIDAPSAGRIMKSSRASRMMQTMMSALIAIAMQKGSFPRLRLLSIMEQDTTAPIISAIQDAEAAIRTEV